MANAKKKKSPMVRITIYVDEELLRQIDADEETRAKLFAQAERYAWYRAVYAGRSKRPNASRIQTPPSFKGVVHFGIG